MREKYAREMEETILNFLLDKGFDVAGPVNFDDGGAEEPEDCTVYFECKGERDEVDYNILFELMGRIDSHDFDKSHTVKDFRSCFHTRRITTSSGLRNYDVELYIEFCYCS